MLKAVRLVSKALERLRRAWLLRAVLKSMTSGGRMRFICCIDSFESSIRSMWDICSPMARISWAVAMSVTRIPVRAAFSMGDVLLRRPAMKSFSFFSPHERVRKLPMERPCSRARDLEISTPVPDMRVSGRFFCPALSCGDKDSVRKAFSEKGSIPRSCICFPWSSSTWVYLDMTGAQCFIPRETFSCVNNEW